MQCSRKNIACPGYKSKSLVWSTKHEKLLLAGPELSGAPLDTGATSGLAIANEVSKDHFHVIEPTSASQEPKNEGSETTVHPNSPSSVATTDSRPDLYSSTDSLSAIRQQLHQSAVPEFLLHLPTMLVEYYFNYVCQIFSSFDGSLNPFRSTVGKLWDGSAPIYYAIQSMAAAYLANHFPRMLPVGAQMQREAYRCLYQSQQEGLPTSDNLDKTLLTLLLVGQTTAWHNPKDLGLVHLKTAKRLNRRRLEQQKPHHVAGTGNRTRRQNEFFEQCILYWDMLAGYVDDDIDELGFGEFKLDDIADYQAHGNTSTPDKEKEKVFPHPWTGVAPRVQKLFAQVGRLIRRYRKSIAQDAASMNMLSLDLGFDIQYSQDSLATLDAIQKAQLLEEELLSFAPPSISLLVDAGDENTPVQQYIYLAEAYQCAALLEIYRMFPSILLKRVPLTGSMLESLPDKEPMFEFLDVSKTQSPDDFLVFLAMHTISLLEKFPSNSGTRCLQPILHIVAASELRFSPPSNLDPLSAFAPASSIFNSLTNREVDIASARRFVVTRLQEFQLSLPAKPIVKALELIQETWARADLGQEVYWMDVMDQMGWASIFG